MKKLLIAIALFSLLKTQPVHAARVHLFSFYTDSEPERLMNLFLKVLQDNSDAEVHKFIDENYSKKFLEIPMNIHVKVINDLRRDFSRYIVTQTIKGDNKITVLIKSPVNKTKKITIETDAKTPAKIFIIDIKDVY